MKTESFLVFAATMILSVAGIAHATDVAGDVSGVWNVAGSPYFAIGDLTVLSGDTLDIQPGVRVLFTGRYKLNVYGTLRVAGTEQDSVVFTTGASVSGRAAMPRVSSSA